LSLTPAVEELAAPTIEGAMEVGDERNRIGGQDPNGSLDGRSSNLDTTRHRDPHRP
jgi:hypothetical protein